jgi:hypothetical protein
LPRVPSFVEGEWTPTRLAPRRARRDGLHHHHET